MRTASLILNPRPAEARSDEVRASEKSGKRMSIQQNWESRAGRAAEAGLPGLRAYGADLG
jgi:hypothetical protein